MRLVAAFVCAVMLICFGVAPGHAEKHVALVIGNGAYRSTPRLTNPRNDAEDVAAALKRTGFETIVGLDLDQSGMQEVAIRFARTAREAEVAVFYYSGHAIQYAGANYLLPVDAQLTDGADLRRLARVDDIVADLQQAKNLRILVLDSCRDNPLAEDLKRRSASVQRGLARLDSPQGMIVAYATQAGRTADDGAGRNSPYTAAFLKQIETPEEIGTVFRRISADVYQATQQKQLPELSLSLIGEFYLHGKPEIPAKETDVWLTSAEYKKLFDKMVSQRHYPRAIEGRVFGDKVLFKAAFSAYPEGKFSFWSAHGIAADEFARRDRNYRAAGYSLVYRQSVKFGDAEVVQATWVQN
jgi:uncharacterized caspase-like protein